MWANNRVVQAGCRASLLYSSRAPEDVLMLDELRAVQVLARSTAVFGPCVCGNNRLQLHI